MRTHENLHLSMHLISVFWEYGDYLRETAHGIESPCQAARQDSTNISLYANQSRDPF